MIIRRHWILQIFLLLATNAFCGDVDLRTGNFSLEIQDLHSSGQGLSIDLIRVYNSASNYIGMFGLGWSSNLETSLQVFPDGTAVIHEWGGGARSVFESRSDSKVLENAIQQTIQGAQKHMRLNGTAAVASYSKRLHDDATFRRQEWRLLLRQHVVSEPSFPEGTRWISGDFGHEELLRLKLGYQRIRSDGLIELFDLRGRLARIENRNGCILDFKYDPDGRVISVIDNFLRGFRLDWQGAPRVQSVNSNDGRHIAYRYTPTGEMIGAESSQEKPQIYTWDPNHRSLLIRVSTGLGTEEISYNGRDKFETVKSHRDLLGRIAEYTYEWQDGSVRSATEVLKDKSGQPVISKKVQYSFIRNGNGEAELAGKTEILDGHEFVTEYGGCCHLPVRIRSADGVLTQDYSPTGLIIRRAGSEGAVEYLRRPENGALLKITKTNKNASSPQITTFSYDPSGNLAGVHADDFKAVLARDRFGRIQAVSDSGQHRFDFIYDEHSYIQEISGSGLSVKVVYRDYAHPIALRTSTRPDLSVLTAILLKLQHYSPEGDFIQFLQEIENLTHLRTIPG